MGGKLGKDCSIVVDRSAIRSWFAEQTTTIIVRSVHNTIASLEPIVVRGSIYVISAQFDVAVAKL